MPITQQTDRRSDYNDYLSWPDDERWEIIDGEAYNMSPAPKVKHQIISGNLFSEMKNQLKKKSKNGTPFSAPTDVVFDDYNVVQPDIFVVCDKSKITENNIKGAPKLIIEITSFSTVLKDKREKRALYEKFGVSEYILIHPENEYVEQFFLTDGKYGAADILNWDEELKLKAFDIIIYLWEIFEKELPKKEKENNEKTDGE